jgi:hypothetical protein
MKRRIFYLLRDVICSILITVFIVYGGYWLTFHTGDQGYTGLRFSIITAPVMFITTMSAITFAVLFFVFTGLVSLVALATGKIIARISAQAKNPPTTPPRQ